eukprot:m51a1_g4867 putative protein fantom (1304) ;mRNA; r:341137-346614
MAGWTVTDFDTSSVHSRPLVSGAGARGKPSYEELEERYYELQGSQLDARRRANEQDDKLKQMATKLARMEARGGGGRGGGRGPRGSAAAAAAEEEAEALREQLLATARQNEALRRRLQLEALYRQRPGGATPANPYAAVRPRVDTGLAKRMIPLLNGHVSVTASVQRTRFAQSGLAPPRAPGRAGTEQAMIGTSIGGVVVTQQRRGVGGDEEEEDYGGFDAETPRGDGDGEEKQATTPRLAPSVTQQVSKSTSTTRLLSPRGEAAQAALLPPVAAAQQERVAPETLFRMVREDAAYRLEAVDQRSLVELVRYLVDRAAQPDREAAQAQDECHRYRDELREVRSKLAYAEEQLAVAQASLQRQSAMMLDGTSNRELEDQLHEKLTELRILQSKYEMTEATTKGLKESHEKLLEQYEQLNKALLDEKAKSRQLESDLKIAAIDRAGGSEYLQDAAKKDQVFDQERAAYKQRVEQLEQRIASEAEDSRKLSEQYKGVKDKLEQSLKELRDELDKAHEEKRETQLQMVDLQTRLENAEAKLKFLSDDAGAEISEIESALAYLKTRKAEQTQGSDLRAELEDLQMAYQQLSEDAEKLRSLLREQEDINAQYKRELAERTASLETSKQHYEGRLEEQARALDVKKETIRKLEGQVTNALFGNPSRTAQKAKTTTTDGVIHDESELHLTDEENAVELFIGKVALSQDLYSADIDTFVVFDFFDYETIVTPALPGVVTEPKCTVFYKTKVDAFFLHYLRSYSLIFEVYKAHGSEYALMGSGIVTFKDLLTKPGKLVGSADIISADDNVTPIGILRYTTRMLRPIEEEVKVFNARERALVLAGQLPETPRFHLADSLVRNALIVKVVSCSGLQATSPSPDAPPSPFVCYQFFDYPDYYTQTVPHTRDPVFDGDMQTYSVSVNNDLEEYLLSSRLEVLVCDEDDPRGDSLLGIAYVDLSPLLHDRIIEDRFPLADAAGSPAGFVQLHLYWQTRFKRDVGAMPRRPLGGLEPEAAEPRSEASHASPREAAGEDEPREEPTEEPQAEEENFEVRVAEPQGHEEEEEDRRGGRPERGTYTQADRPRSRRRRMAKDRERTPHGPQDDHFEQDADELAAELLEAREPSRGPSPASPAQIREAPEDPLLQTAAFEGKTIVVVVEKLELLPAVNEGLSSVAVALEFLRSASDPSMISEWFPKSSNPFEINYRREFPLSDYGNRFKLFTVMTSAYKADALVLFDVCNRTERQVQIVGTAELNLHDVLVAQDDVRSVDIEVRDSSLVRIGSLWVSVFALDALRSILDNISLVSSALPSVSMT